MPKGSAKREQKSLRGDGTWPFEAEVDGQDIVVQDIVITCFGGWGDGKIDDPQDNGHTSSGRNTKTEQIEGVAIPMDSRQFPGMKQRDLKGYRTLLGSPLPKIDWGTKVEVTIAGKTFTPKDGIVDLGPGKRATQKASEPHALDLTPRAARLVEPNTAFSRLARNFKKRGSYRILGGAKFVQQTDTRI
jgi:hypothetical protein